MVSDCFLSWCWENLGVWLERTDGILTNLPRNLQGFFVKRSWASRINEGAKRTSETKRDVDYEGRWKTNSFCSVNSSIAYFTPSRPSPESFTPP